MSRRHVGAALIVGALLLAGAAFLMWTTGTEDAEADQLAEEFRAAINGDLADDVEPDRAGPIALGAVSAVLFLAGVVLATGPSPDS